MVGYGENEVLICSHCNLHVIQLYNIKNRLVCRFCKKDFEVNGKFTRPKVEHDYLAIEQKIRKILEAQNGR